MSNSDIGEIAFIGQKVSKIVSEKHIYNIYNIIGRKKSKPKWCTQLVFEIHSEFLVPHSALAEGSSPPTVTLL